MDATEFACFFERLQKEQKTEIDSDIIGKIFDYYEYSHENYTLLELIGLLDRELKIDITCPWNKKEIIKMIEKENLNIPKKKEAMEPTEWTHYRVRKSLDVIETKYMEFYDGSIVQFPDGDPYHIEFIDRDYIKINADNEEEKEIVIINWMNLATNEQFEMNAEEFIYMLDNEDVTILQDRNRAMYMNEEQKTKWTNHVRYM